MVGQRRASRRSWSLFIILLAAVIAVGLLLRGWLASLSIPDFEGVFFTSSFNLAEHRVDGDLVVVAEEIVLPAGSALDGNAALVGGFISVDGVQVSGDLTVVGEVINVIEPTVIAGSASLLGDMILFSGTVEGDLRVTGDRLTLAPSARVNGYVYACVEKLQIQGADIRVRDCDARTALAPLSALIALREEGLVLSPLLPSQVPAALLAAMFALTSLLLAALTTLTATLFPRQISLIEDAVRARPRSLAGAGLAVFLLAAGLGAGLLVLLAVLPPLGLLLLPLYAIGGLLLLVLVAAGLVTLALMLGDWLLRRITRVPPPPLVAAATGSLALALAFLGLSLLPYGYVISPLLLVLVSSVGLGAALFTRLGTRSLRRSYFVQG
ncbi:MAG: polymer-forming cytoskeletal protein [Aggregatilineales bacterium]